VRFSLRTGRYLEKEAEKVSDEQEAQIVLPSTPRT
jgi:hypothetical protein